MLKVLAIQNGCAKGFGVVLTLEIDVLPILDTSAHTKFPPLGMTDLPYIKGGGIIRGNVKIPCL